MKLFACQACGQHRLFYSLILLRLPLANRIGNPEHGLAFDFLAEPSTPHATHVMTGTARA